MTCYRIDQGFGKNLNIHKTMPLKTNDCQIHKLNNKTSLLGSNFRQKGSMMKLKGSKITLLYSRITLKTSNSRQIGSMMRQKGSTTSLLYSMVNLKDPNSRQKALTVSRIMFSLLLISLFFPYF